MKNYSPQAPPPATGPLIGMYPREIRPWRAYTTKPRSIRGRRRLDGVRYIRLARHDKIYGRRRFAETGDHDSFIERDRTRREPIVGGRTMPVMLLVVPVISVMVAVYERDQRRSAVQGLNGEGIGSLRQRRNIQRKVSEGVGGCRSRNFCSVLKNGDACIGYPQRH